MVRLAFPGDDKNHFGQPGVCQGGETHGYVSSGHRLHHFSRSSLRRERRLPDKRRLDRLCCHPPRRIGSHRQGRRRNIHGHGNIGIRPRAHTRALRSGRLHLGVSHATFRVFAQSHDCDRSQPYRHRRRARRCSANLPRGISAQLGETSSEYRADPWRRKSAFPRAQDEARHAKIWTHIPRLPCRPSATQVKGQGLCNFPSRFDPPWFNLHCRWRVW